MSSLPSILSCMTTYRFTPLFSYIYGFVVLPSPALFTTLIKRQPDYDVPLMYDVPLPSAATFYNKSQWDPHLVSQPCGVVAFDGTVCPVPSVLL